MRRVFLSKLALLAILTSVGCSTTIPPSDGADGGAAVPDNGADDSAPDNDALLSDPKGLIFVGSLRYLTGDQVLTITGAAFADGLRECNVDPFDDLIESPQQFGDCKVYHAPYEGEVGVPPSDAIAGYCEADELLDAGSPAELTSGADSAQFVGAGSYLSNDDQFGYALDIKKGEAVALDFPGGEDIEPFAASIIMPLEPALLSPELDVPGFHLDRASGLELAWHVEVPGQMFLLMISALYQEQPGADLYTIIRCEFADTGVVKYQRKRWRRYL